MGHERTGAAKQKQPRLLTIADMAAEAQVSTRTIRREIAAGRIAVLRLGPGGRLVRAEAGAFRAYLAARGA